LIPELQVFYHGDPERWLEVPEPLLSAYVEMLPILRAEAALASLTIGGLVMGGTSGLEAQAIIAQWQRLARHKPEKQTASPAMLAEMGIRYIEEP
jgi:hypothetical protein